MPADDSGAIQKPLCSALDQRALVRVDMSRVGRKLTRMVPSMNGDLLHATVKDSDQARLPADPDALATVLRRHRVISAPQFDVAVGMNRAARLLETGEQTGGQGQEFWLLHFLKDPADLLLGRPMDARVGNVLLPLSQKTVLLGQALKASAFEGVVLHV